MSAEQLALIPEAPTEPTPLTDRQQHALDTVRQAGIDGVHADEIGAALCAWRGRHNAGDRCTYDGQNGNQVLRRLRELGHVRYSAKLKSWLYVEAADAPLPGMLPDDQPLPF